MTNEEAIKKLQQQKAEYLENWVDYSGVAEAFDMAIEALKQTTLILCSEKPPSEDGQYLCLEELGFYYVDSFKNGKWSLHDIAGANCVAWRPLPETYTGGTE